MSPFDFVFAITQSKEDLFKKDPQNEKEYNAFIINRALSNFTDTIMHANEMNRCAQIPKKAQFKYYMSAISKKKRFSKWEKKDPKSESLQNVMTYYHCNLQVARDYLNILTDDQVEIINSRMNKGGK